MKIIKRKQKQLERKDYRLTTLLKQKAKKRHRLFHHVNYEVNPFIAVTKPIQEIHAIEDIAIQVEGLFRNYYELKYVLQAPELPLELKRELIDVLIREWEYEYYECLDNELEDTLERASYNPIKRIVRIRTWQVALYILLTFFCFLFLSRRSYFQWIPKIGPFFKAMHTMLIYRRYFIAAQIFGYVSMAIAVYLAIVKVYFDKVLTYGLSAKGFLIRERDRMLKKMKPQKRLLRRYLMSLSQGKKPKPLTIQSLYNPKTVVSRIKSYGRTIIFRIGVFTNYYQLIIFISRLIRLVHAGLLGYLIYGFLRTNRLYPF